MSYSDKPLMSVDVRLLRNPSEAIRIEGVEYTYTKNDVYSVVTAAGWVHRFPLAQVLRMTEAKP